MHPFEFALAIGALVLIFKTFKLLMARRETRSHGRDESLNEDLLARLAQVEERVRVLERIVTDDRFDLRQQFKDLES